MSNNVAGFVYYIPKRKFEVADHLEEFRLQHAFDRRPSLGETTRGPDGGTGVLLANSDALLSSRQDLAWRPVPTSATQVSMVGRPGPTDLERPSSMQLPGHLVELAGHQWIIPAAQAFGDVNGAAVCEGRLPTAHELGDDGQWVPTGIEARFAPLWAVCCRWIDTVSRWAADAAAKEDGKAGDASDETSGDLGFQQMNEAAVVALSVNYRIGPAETDLLKLLTTSTMVAILNAVIDWPTVIAIKKKTVVAT